MNGGRVIVLAKAPRPGFAKSRLAADLDPAAAAAIAAVLLDRTAAALREFTQVELRVTPDDAGAEFERWRQREWVVKAQGDGDLGARLRRAVDEAFAAGQWPVVVVGTDCPALSGADIREALEALATEDVVLGPAEDGGYWLVGLRAGAAAAVVFEGIPWSTPSVFEQTLRRAREAGLSVRTLRRLGDVDTLEDWRHWLRSEIA